MFTNQTPAEPLLPKPLESKKANISIPTKKFLTKTIEVAIDQFESGCHLNKDLYISLSKNSQNLKDQFRALDTPGSTVRTPQYKDDLFPHYNANVISDSNLIAAAGPKSEEDVAIFFYSLLRLSHPVQEIVAFGDLIKPVQSGIKEFDFVNYFTVPGIYKTADYEIHIECTQSEGALSTNEEGQLFSPTEEPIRSKLKVKYIPLSHAESKENQPWEKEVNVTFHSLVDNSFQDLEASPDSYNEVFWQHFKKAQEVPTLVHCAAGVGRTGQFILLMEMVRNFERIFSNKTEKQAAAEILLIVERLRQNRPGIVWTEEQFHMAIYNAVVLQKYALKKGYSFDEYPPVLHATSTLPWKDEFKPDLGDEEALTRIKNELLGELVQYRGTLQSNSPKKGCSFFCCGGYSDQINIKAINFLIDLLEGRIPDSGTIAEHQGPLRAGPVGKIIRKYAHSEEELGTVRNLLVIAYNTAYKYGQKPIITQSLRS